MAFDLSGARYRITVTKPSTSVNSIGQPTGSPTTVATLWAAWNPQRRREYESDGRVIAEYVDQFVVRYRNDITVGMFVSVGRGGNTSNYEISNIVYPDANVSMQLWCRRVE